MTSSAAILSISYIQLELDGWVKVTYDLCNVGVDFLLLEVGLALCEHGAVAQLPNQLQFAAEERLLRVSVHHDDVLVAEVLLHHVLHFQLLECARQLMQRVALAQELDELVLNQLQDCVNSLVLLQVGARAQMRTLVVCLTDRRLAAAHVVIHRLLGAHVVDLTAASLRHGHVLRREGLLLHEGRHLLNVVSAVVAALPCLTVFNASMAFLFE